MTYWGAPSPGGSKFYLGSSSDTAWNHDILWKARVEKEVAELDPSLDLFSIALELLPTLLLG